VQSKRSSLHAIVHCNLIKYSKTLRDISGERAIKVHLVCGVRYGKLLLNTKLWRSSLYSIPSSSPSLSFHHHTMLTFGLKLVIFINFEGAVAVELWYHDIKPSNKKKF
jgi:hypothetical protein